MQAPSETAPTLAEAPAPEPRGLQAWSFPFWVWLGSRLVLLYAGWIGMAVESRFGQYPTELPLTNPLPPLLAPLCRWDCVWYFYVARDGYANGPQTNFF